MYIRTDISSEPAIEVAGISHSYGDHAALENVSLTVEKGSMYGLLGPNGGGKTSLFRILSTLMQPSKGKARVLGFDTTNESDDVRRTLGVIFQQPALDDSLTVEHNLKFHGAMYGLSGESLMDRIDKLSRFFGVDGRRKDRAGTLSGGLQRRVDLARGLLHEPPVLLLDEPTHGLDPIARNELWTLLANLRKNHGTTMMVATHLLDEADKCDHVGIMHQGRLVVQGRPDKLKSDLGRETLWLETGKPDVLAQGIEARFGIMASLAAGAVQVSHPEAHTLLGSLYETFDTIIDSATVRKPTLEDVFMSHTGHRLEMENELADG